MKKILNWILWPLLAFFGFLIGLFARQPAINKLKKQVILLQQDNENLLNIIEANHQSFQELLVQHKALKAIQISKKTALKDQMVENLIMQYAVKEYLTLLLKCGKHGQKLEKDELVFFSAFEKVINGKTLSSSNKVNIKDYILSRHKANIKKLQECDCSHILKELQETH